MREKLKKFIIPSIVVLVLVNLGLSILISSNGSTLSLSWVEVVLSFSLLVSLSGLFWLSLNKIIKNGVISGILSSLLVLTVCSAIKESWFLTILFVVLVLVLLGVRRRVSWNLIYKLLGPTLVILVVTQSVSLAQNPPRISETVSSVLSITDNLTPGNSIYLIVLDEYPSQDECIRQFGYDNQEFIDSLLSRGLVVEKNYYTSFPRTVLSIQSIISMDYYIPVLNGGAIFESEGILGTLNDFGYRSILVSSGWGGSRYIPNFNYTVQTPESLFSKFGDLVFYDSSSWWSQEYWYSTSKFQYQQLVESGSLGNRIFIFAHCLGTHSPYIFDKNGELPQSGLDKPSLVLGQLEYTNSKIIEFLDNINLETSIVIITSDHGPFTEEFTGVSEVSGIDFSKGNYSDFIKSRLSGFLAVNFPGVTNLSSEDLCQVNLFRTVSREYFGIESENLPSRHFFIEDWTSSIPSIFEITNILEGNN